MSKFSSVCIFFFLVNFAVYGQYQNFQGKITYKVIVDDSIKKSEVMLPDMWVFTNDTISRVEVMTNALGKQVTIKHMSLNKSYLLLTLADKNFAIQTSNDSLEKPSASYSYKRLRKCSKRINGFKTDVYLATRKSDNKQFTITVFKEIRPEILDVYKGAPGLPAEYIIETSDGPITYRANAIKEELPSKDLFGIPSNYKRLSMTEFLNMLTTPEN